MKETIRQKVHRDIQHMTLYYSCCDTDMKLYYIQPIQRERSQMN